MTRWKLFVDTKIPGEWRLVFDTIVEAEYVQTRDSWLARGHRVKVDTFEVGGTTASA